MSRSGGKAGETFKHMQGRVASVLNRVEVDLLALGEVREFYRKMPFIDRRVPIVVIAGAPNVGKSALLQAISHATPEVAPYPFTTKGIRLGHIGERHGVQIIDTPGLLDRDPEERNEIELKAAAAVLHLAHLLLYIYDPSGTNAQSVETPSRAGRDRCAARVLRNHG